ncbi:unnamed protein product, partial [Owenia fusiformis]
VPYFGQESDVMIRQSGNILVGQCRPVQKVCKDNGDCLNTQCCRCPLMRKGKRQIEPCVCQDNGVNGAQCIVEHNDADLLTFEKFCPCSNGFTCHGNGMVAIPLGEHGECQPTVEEKTPCTSQKQCKTDECCLSIHRPIGKRGIEERQPQAFCEKRGICDEGTCQPKRRFKGETKCEALKGK